MQRVIIPLGTRIGRLVVEDNDIRVPGGDGKLRWGNVMRCDCGRSCVMKNGVRLRKVGYCGNDCGLRWDGNDKGLDIDFTDPPGWYRSYNAMKGRCSATAETHPANFKNYVERGITVCARWLDHIPSISGKIWGIDQKV